VNFVFEESEPMDIYIMKRNKNGNTLTKESSEYADFRSEDLAMLSPLEFQICMMKKKKAPYTGDHRICR
jgi:hypothetical protein